MSWYSGMTKHAMNTKVEYYSMAIIRKTLKHMDGHWNINQREL